MYTRVRDFGASTVTGTAAAAAVDTRAPVDAGATLTAAGAADELADAAADTTALLPAEGARTAAGATDTVDTPNGDTPTPDVAGFEGAPNPKLNNELTPALLLLLLLLPPNTKPLPLDDDPKPNDSAGATTTAAGTDAGAEPGRAFAHDAHTLALLLFSTKHTSHCQPPLGTNPIATLLNSTPPAAHAALLALADDGADSTPQSSIFAA